MHILTVVYTVHNLTMLWLGGYIISASAICDSVLLCLSTTTQPWHKACFTCEVCNLKLTMKTYKGYNKLPYCNTWVITSFLLSVESTTLSICSLCYWHIPPLYTCMYSSVHTLSLVLLIVKPVNSHTLMCCCNVLSTIWTNYVFLSRPVSSDILCTKAILDQIVCLTVSCSVCLVANSSSTCMFIIIIIPAL